ncbi:MAG: NYN domain-containing protein [Deltaproteobacteria bacterium]|nr:NYN domain-containing protein [Deltaproteobacteria bacterium]
MKIAIFIDGGYLDKVVKNEFGIHVHIDYEKIAKELSLGKEILRTYYYHCEPYQSNPTTSDEKERFSKAQKFHSMLNKLPRYEVRLGKLQCIKVSSGKKALILS